MNKLLYILIEYRAEWWCLCIRRSRAWVLWLVVDGFINKVTSRYKYSYSWKSISCVPSLLPYKSMAWGADEVISAFHQAYDIESHRATVSFTYSYLLRYYDFNQKYLFKVTHFPFIYMFHDVQKFLIIIIISVGRYINYENAYLLRKKYHIRYI